MSATFDSAAALRAAQRSQEHERVHGTPESYEAATARVADILTALRPPRVVSIPGRIGPDGVESPTAWTIIGRPGTFATYAEAAEAVTNPQ